MQAQSAQGGEKCGVGRRFDFVVNTVDVEGEVHGDILCRQVALELFRGIIPIAFSTLEGAQGFQDGSQISLREAGHP